jgi:exodeoxyribonuclease-1
MSLVFYDTETTGTETFFDQILQFAAIQTDEELNEIDRFEIRCRLLPHVVPAPGAMRVTGVKVSQLTDPSHPSHYAMVRSVCAKLESWSPALFLGWNSIEFDEKLVRQALYKTLHNPYLTNRAGNSRSDVMRIAQACSLFAANALEFPADDKGQKVFKLDRIAPANGFKHDLAHDAMGDVEATIFLCRRLLKKAPHIWSSFMRFSTKAAVVDYITDERVFCVSDFFFGRPHSCLVTTIGQNGKNKAEWYVYNLGVDPESLLSLSEAQLVERLNESPKPIRRLKSNAAPMLFPAEDAPEICNGREHGLEELERRAVKLQKNKALCERLVSAFESRKEEYPPSLHVEKQIYDGFTEKADEELMSAFHKAEWSKRHAIVENFKDARLKAIGKQLIHLERPDLLDKSVRLKHDLAAAKRLLGQGEEISWLTLPQAIEELEGMIVDASGAELEFLREHEQYLRECHKQARMRVKDA